MRTPIHPSCTLTLDDCYHVIFGIGLDLLHASPTARQMRKILRGLVATEQYLPGSDTVLWAHVADQVDAYIVRVMVE